MHSALTWTDKTLSVRKRSSNVRLPTRSILLAGAMVWCAAIVAAPIFRLTFVYESFSMICHQDPARSWRVAGESFAVCIRCCSIYFGFFAGLIAGLPPNARWLKMAIAANAAEFLLALIVVDSAGLRILSGLALGATTAPFVLIGVEQILAGATRDSM